MAPPETRHLTFLFADIEGSTRLMERHGADAGAALSRYHELVALAASRHGGKLFERIGDGAYACFDAATDAVAAADAVQRAIIGASNKAQGGKTDARIDRIHVRDERRKRTASASAVAAGTEVEGGPRRVPPDPIVPPRRGSRAR